MKTKTLLITTIIFFAFILVGCGKISTNDSGVTVPNEDSNNTDNNAILHIVTFNTDGGEPLSSLTVKNGNSINLPIPVKTGYIFLGWFTGTTVNDGQFTSLNAVQSNITLYARWEATLELLKSNAISEVQAFYVLTGHQGEVLEIMQENLTSSVILINQASTISLIDQAVRAAKAKYEIILVFIPYSEKCDEIDAKYETYISGRESSIRTYQIYMDNDYANTIIKNDHPNYRTYSLSQVTTLRNTAYNSYQACLNNFSCGQSSQMSTRQNLYFEWDKVFNQMTRISNYNNDISQARRDWDAEIADEEANYNMKVNQIKVKYGVN